MTAWRIVLPLLAIAPPAAGASFRVIYQDAKDAQDAPIAQAMRDHRLL